MPPPSLVRTNSAVAGSFLFGLLAIRSDSYRLTYLHDHDYPNCSAFTPPCLSWTREIWNKDSHYKPSSLHVGLYLVATMRLWIFGHGTLESRLRANHTTACLPDLRVGWYGTVWYGNNTGI